MDELLVITCIRHGLTEGNKKRAYVGWTNQALAKEGKKALLQRCHQYPNKPDLIVGSDLERCRETAGILYPNVPYIGMKDWRELHFGDWEGKTHEQLKGDKTYQAWLTAPFHTQIQNGEHFFEFSDRIWKAWDLSVSKLISQKGNRLIIFSHGGVIKLLASAFSNKKTSFWDWHFSPGEGVTWVHTIQTARSKQGCISYSAVPLMERENG